MSSELRTVAIKQSRDLGYGMGMMLIDVDPPALASVQKVLPGWLIDPNLNRHFT